MSAEIESRRLVLLSVTAPELLQRVFGQKLEYHLADHVRLLHLHLAVAADIREVQAQLLDMLEAYVFRTEKG